MKVLFQSRKTLFTVPGGDTVQIMKTKEYLERFGISIDITTDLKPDLKGYDLVHIFNLMRGQEIYLQAFNAKRQGKKVALSTICGLYTEYERKARGGLAQVTFNVLSPYLIEYLKILARTLKNREVHKGTIALLLRGYYSTLKKTVGAVDVFLPNSKSEMKRVMNDFGIHYADYVVVPNAVDVETFNYDETQVKGAIGLEGCILCVARIEGRKSQLSLVRAVKGLPYTLVFIGQPAPNHRHYYQMVRREAGDNVVFLGQIPHAELPQYYKAAKVHALISWMETPGLSSLEAAAMKCNIVITRKGDTEDYFGDYAFYCEPDSIESIRNTIVRAYKSPLNPELRKLILENYTWQKAAEKTLEAYKYALCS